MSITLVAMRRARRGQAAALTETAVRLFSSLDSWDPARLRLRVFQGRYRPDLLLVVSDWMTRAAAWRNLTNSPLRPPLDALSANPPEYSFYRELSVHEEHHATIAAAACTRFQCRPSAVPAVLSFLLESSGPTIRAQRGLVSYALYQDEDRPNRFLSIRGWASEAAMEAVFRTLAPRFDAELRARGATIMHFRGRPLVDLHGPPG